MMDKSNENEVPMNVILALAEVRESGTLNMFDRQGVIVMSEEIDEEAADWLRQNKSRYMDALNAMGEYISQ